MQDLNNCPVSIFFVNEKFKIYTYLLNINKLLYKQVNIKIEMGDFYE